jgi:hypothetical protein
MKFAWLDLPASGGGKEGGSLNLALAAYRPEAADSATVVVIRTEFTFKQPQPPAARTRAASRLRNRLEVTIDQMWSSWC